MQQTDLKISQLKHVHKVMVTDTEKLEMEKEKNPLSLVLSSTASSLSSRTQKQHLQKRCSCPTSVYFQHLEMFRKRKGRKAGVRVVASLHR